MAATNWALPSQELKYILNELQLFYIVIPNLPLLIIRLIVNAF